MREPVIRTFSGGEVNPTLLLPSQVRVRDIAHALACVNRFAGHTRRPISVAQHSVYVARLCQHLPVRYQMQALFHDASEAYLGDVTKWLKMDPIMAGYREAEELVQTAIYIHFSLPAILHQDVEEADRIMIRFEGSHPHGFGQSFRVDHPNYPPLTKEQIERVGPWQPWSWMQAEENFLDWYRHLGGVVD